MKYTNINVFSLTLLLIILSFSALAYTPNWKITFNNQLESYSDSFTAGAGSPATDGYDSLDLRHPPPPPSTHIQMYTLVDETLLTSDYRADLEIGIPKIWEITLVAFDPTLQGLSGTNEITWGDLPEDLSLTLVDYGSDNSKTNIINTINLKEKSSYDFHIDEASGAYRYLNLVAEKIQTITQNLSEEEQLLEELPPNEPSKRSRKSSSRASCTPEWVCSEWSECINNKRARECIDERGCNEDSSKEIESCVSPIKEDKPEKKEETPQKTTKKSDSIKITGAAITKISPQTNIFIGVLIISIWLMIIIIGVITIFYLLTKK